MLSHLSPGTSYVFAINLWSCVKLAQISHVLAPKFFGEGPLNFGLGIIKPTKILIVWQSFMAIDRGISEISWRKT